MWVPLKYLLESNPILITDDQLKFLMIGGHYALHTIKAP